MKTALIAGGTFGIGRAVAFELARQGYHLILIGSGEPRGQQAVAAIEQQTGNTNVQFIQADLSLMAENQRVAELVARHWPQLDWLVFTAVRFQPKRLLTAEGNEATFALYALSRFYLL